MIVDASCSYEVVADRRSSRRPPARLVFDPDQAAPSVVEDRRDGPGERFEHRQLLGRV